MMRKVAGQSIFYVFDLVLKLVLDLVMVLVIIWCYRLVNRMTDSVWALV